MVCSKCKANLAEHSSFCHVCGNRIREKRIGNHSAVEVYTVSMMVIYGIALLVCLICNLTIEGTLSWFYIVAASILLSFSILNLPFLVKKHRVLCAAAAATVMVYVLLFVCCVYAKGDWLLSVAYPIATYWLIYAWLMFVTIRYVKINSAFKAAIVLFLTALFTVMSNLFINALLDESFAINSLIEDGTVNYIGNTIASVCLLFASIVCGIVGICRAVKARRSK